MTITRQVCHPVQFNRQKQSSAHAAVIKAPIPKLNSVQPLTPNKNYHEFKALMANPQQVQLKATQVAKQLAKDYFPQSDLRFFVPEAKSTSKIWALREQDDAIPQDWFRMRILVEKASMEDFETAVARLQKDFPRAEFGIKSGKFGLCFAKAHIPLKDMLNDCLTQFPTAVLEVQIVTSEEQAAMANNPFYHRIYEQLKNVDGKDQVAIDLFRKWNIEGTWDDAIDNLGLAPQPPPESGWVQHFIPNFV